MKHLDISKPTPTPPGQSRTGNYPTCQRKSGAPDFGLRRTGKGGVGAGKPAPFAGGAAWFSFIPQWKTAGRWTAPSNCWNALETLSAATSAFSICWERISSRMDTSNAWDKGSSSLMSGKPSPRSHLETALSVTDSLSASCFWVNPFAFRRDESAKLLAVHCSTSFAFRIVLL